MRKVVLSELLSLDGVAEDPETFFFDWDQVADAHGAAVIATQDAVVRGRRSCDEWSEFWPGSEVEPFATFINEVPKYVASSVKRAGPGGARSPHFPQAYPRVGIPSSAGYFREL